MPIFLPAVSEIYPLTSSIPKTDAARREDAFAAEEQFCNSEKKMRQWRNGVWHEPYFMRWLSWFAGRSFFLTWAFA